MRIVAFAFVAGTLLLTGCAGAEPMAAPKPTTSQLPSSTPKSCIYGRCNLAVGSVATLSAPVHCGLQYLEINAAKWESTVRYDKASRGPGIRMRLKPDLNERISGTLTRPKADQVVFKVDAAFTVGGPLTVVFHPASGVVPGCA